MNNPFCIPDEVFDLIVASAVKQGLHQSTAGGTKRPAPNTPPQKKTTPEEAAKAAKELYDSYVNAGFNEVQAFELLKLVLNK